MNQVLLTKFKAQSKKRDELFALLVEAADYMKTYPGCTEYRVFKDAKDGDTVCVLESWVDDNSHKESLNDLKVKDSIARGMQLIEKIVSQEKLLE